MATVGVSLVALHINVFARSSASPGSLYGFVQEELGSWFGLVAGWSVLIAYIGTASAVTGGVVIYAQGMLGGFLYATKRCHSFDCLECDGSDVSRLPKRRAFTRFMLWIEAASIALIVLLFLYPSHEHHLFWDAKPVFSPGIPIGFRASWIDSGNIQLRRI